MSRKIRYELEDPSDWIERETEDGRMMARELRNKDSGAIDMTR